MKSEKVIQIYLLLERYWENSFTLRKLIMTKLIAASILSADFSKLGEEIRAVEAAGTDWLHLDVMDGHFVPNLTFGPPLIEKIRQITSLPLDVHLMITNADATFVDYLKAGANSLSVHVEACPEIEKTLLAIRRQSVKASITLNPETPLEKILPFLNQIDMVLVMSVSPGFGGQGFIPASLEKVRKLKEIREKQNLSFLIEIDGGIKTENIAEVSKAGTDVFVVGSGIFKTPNYSKTIQEMKNCLK